MITTFAMNEYERVYTINVEVDVKLIIKHFTKELGKEVLAEISSCFGELTPYLALVLNEAECKSASRLDYTFRHF